MLPVVPFPHRTRDETEGQPHENFLIHVHALRCERWYKTDQSVNISSSVSHAFLFRVFFRLAVTGRNETHVSSYRPASRVPWTSNTRFRVVDFNFFRSFFRFGWVPPSRIHPVPLRARTSANHEYARRVASRTYRFRDTPCAPSSFVVNQLCSFVTCASETQAIKNGFSEFCL